MSGPPLIVAHRGASAGMTDNSLDAFARAIEVGADMIEFDVRRTADDRLIALHDGEVGGSPVSSLTRDAIVQHLGHAPPLLEEVLELAQGRIGLDVELKENGCVERVMAAVAMRSGPHEVVFTSFLDDAVASVKRVDPDARAGLLIGLERPRPYLQTRLSEAFPLRRIRECGADFVAMHHRLADLGAMQKAHSAGYPVFVWTVNDDGALRRFLADERVYAVVTDAPERALALRANSHAG